jgi:hypothetical protein
MPSEPAIATWNRELSQIDLQRRYRPLPDHALRREPPLDAPGPVGKIDLRVCWPRAHST